MLFIIHSTVFLLCAGSVDDAVVANRPRESVYPLISVDEAIQIVMAEADIMDAENVDLTGGVHRLISRVFIRSVV